MRTLHLLWIPVGVLALLTALKYPGHVLVYILFTVTANALLYFGFRREAIFFDAFIGVFLWLGFWLKFTIRLAFFGGILHEPVGHFDGSGGAYDRALLAASYAFAGLILARLLRARVFTYPERVERSDAGMFAFYRAHRRAVLVAYAVLVVAVAASNAYLGIYQRGMVARTVLPFGLNGVYTWLLQFGLASFSAVILHCELRLRRETSYPVVILSLLETFLSNVSLLSRGMVLNASALGYGALRALKMDGISTRARFWVACFMLFVVLFVTSVAAVNYLRNFAGAPQNFIEANRESKALILDRWVGMEGLMAVSSHPRQGWEIWGEAWRERPAASLSFYDRNFIASAYAQSDFSKYNFVSLPGIVAFLFYPGSFVFLLVGMALAGALGAAIEAAVFRLGGKNLILCALLAQVVASRFVHFGYAPAQSYLLFGALALNLLMIYFADRLLSSRDS